MIIERKQYLSELIKKKDNGRIKIITGIRRCGKSYLLFKLYKDYLLGNGIKKEQIIEMALDEIDNIKYRNPFELNDYIKNKITKNKKYYIFIDEIQFSKPVKNPYIIDSDEEITFVDTLLGLMKNENLDIYVTGSNSKMLSKDILTQFRDRGDEIHIYPLSFAEFYNTYKDKNVNIDEIFNKGITGKENHTGLGLWEVKQILKRNNNINLYTNKNDTYFSQQLEIYY